MGDVLLFDFFKYGSLVCRMRVDFHQSVHIVSGVNHCNSIIHDLLFLKFDCIKLVQCFFGSNNSRVLCDRTCVWVDWDCCAEFNARFSKKLESCCVTFELLLDLHVCSRCHFDLSLVLEHLLLVLAIH